MTRFAGQWVCDDFSMHYRQYDISCNPNEDDGMRFRGKKGDRDKFLSPYSTMIISIIASLSMGDGTGFRLTHVVDVSF